MYEHLYSLSTISNQGSETDLSEIVTFNSQTFKYQEPWGLLSGNQATSS